MKRRTALILLFVCALFVVLASCIDRSTAEQQQGVGEENYHTVTFYDGSLILSQEPVEDGGTIANVPQGHEWRDAYGSPVDPVAVAVWADMDLYVREPMALTGGHVRYLTGANRLFQPEGTVSRGLAARILCSLLDRESMNIPETGLAFTDVAQSDPYYADIQAVSGLGVMGGYADGTFRSEEPVTRAELLAALCRLKGVGQIQANAFPDVTAEHWSLGAVAAATTEGWISGYEDGDFRPDLPVTRAETVVMVNRACGRTPNRDAIDLVCETSPYIDVSKDYWAFYDIVDVAYSSDLMAYILGEVEDAQPGFVVIGDDMVHVNADKRLDYFQKGFHTIRDGLDSDGIYFVPENGYFVRRSQTGLQELDGSMFYVEKEDGPFVSDYDLGYLHFGENGRYTSGDEVLDTYVDAMLEPIIQGKTENLLNDECLRSAFNAIAKTNTFDYMVRNTGWIRGSTSWALECARVMYETKHGTCFYWAAAFLYAARRLGYQAYPICGGVGTNNQLHAWVMIDDEDGTEYIYDVELDWAYRTGAHGRTRIRYGMDLFKMQRGKASVFYIFPGDTYYVPPNDDEGFLGSEPTIIWPTEFGSSAFIVVDGESIPVDTSWAEVVDENGILTGYNVTVTYEGVTYSSFVPLAAPPADVTPTPPVEETPPVDVTPTPPAEGTPPVDVTPTPPTEGTPPVDATQPPVDVTDTPVEPETPTTPPVDPQPVQPDSGETGSSGAGEGGGE